MSKSLGRGLGSLIPPKQKNGSSPSSQPSSRSRDVVALSNSSSLSVREIPIGTIQANPYQPRKSFTETQMAELKESIKTHGILQPLLVTKNEKGYELVAGERRFRAAKDLKFKTVPVIVRKSSNLEKLELSIIENVQRQDLNPIEEAESYRRLIEEFDLTQEETAKKIGCSRTQITNAIRLLKLPTAIQRSLAIGKITTSHGKILLGIEKVEDQLRMWKQILDQGLSVHATTGEVEKKGSKKPTRKSRHPFLETQEEDLQGALGTKVNIKPSGRGGKIIMEYYSAEELISIIQKILRKRK